MATIDSNIALGVKPIQIENPMNQYAAMSQIQGNQQAQQLNALKMRQAQQEFDVSNALANAYKGAITPEGNVNYNALIPSLASSGAGSAIPGVLKTKKEAEQAAAMLEKTQTETKAEKLKLIREKTADLVNNPSPENIKAHAQDGLIQGAWDQAQADAFVQQALSVPITQRPAFFKEQSLNAEKRVTTAETSRHNLKTENIASGQLGVAQQNANINQQRLINDYNPDLQGKLTQAKIEGTEYGKSRAQANIALPGTIASAEEAIRKVDAMVGSAPVKDSKGNIIQAGTKPHAGFEQSVGLGIPGLKYIPGTSAADFNARLNEVQGGAFLQAFNSLKGGGSITEKEGEKATQAITRMSTSQSEKEFNTAAREFQDVLRVGIAKAKLKAGVFSNENIDALVDKYSTKD